MRGEATLVVRRGADKRGVVGLGGSFKGENKGRCEGRRWEERAIVPRDCP